MTQSQVVLVMGVASHRSIAWACVEAFRQHNYHVVMTYQNHRMRPAIDKLLLSASGSDTNVHAFPCNVETDIPRLFQEQIPEIVSSIDQTAANSGLDAVVHSIGYAPFGETSTLSQASLEDFQTAHHISAYSLLETAKYAKDCMKSSQNASITALTYLGSQRVVNNYLLMGPAKASLEACVRGLAAEFGHFQPPGSDSHESIRVNAVSAGPLRTLSSRGIPQFTQLWQHVKEKAPLRRNITQEEAANTVRFLASNDATGITGQVIYVDAGYGCVVPV